MNRPSAPAGARLGPRAAGRVDVHQAGELIGANELDLTQAAAPSRRRPDPRKRRRIKRMKKIVVASLAVLALGAAPVAAQDSDGAAVGGAAGGITGAIAG